MGEIPEDVKIAAVDAVLAGCCVLPDVEVVANAILAERKRCTDAVHRVAKDFYGNTDQMYAAALIVSAIESGQ